MEGKMRKTARMNNITLTKEESFSNICSFVFFYFLFLVLPELIVWAGPSCLAWNRHQHQAHTTSESQCGRFSHLETDFPVLPVLCWAAEGFPPCLGSHNGPMWDLLQWDLLQTRCYYSAVEHETCEEGQGQRTWYSPSGGLGKKVCHLWTQWGGQSGVVHVFHLPHCLHKGKKDCCVAGFHSEMRQTGEGDDMALFWREPLLLMFQLARLLLHVSQQPNYSLCIRINDYIFYFWMPI